MSLEGQLHALPRRSIAVRFTSVNRPRSERGGLVPRRGVIGTKAPLIPYSCARFLATGAGAFGISMTQLGSTQFAASLLLDD